MVLLGLALGLASGRPAAIVAVDPPPQSDIEIRITDAGFEPSVVLIEPGQTVVWVNTSTTTQTVTHEGGLFDSGPIPLDGAFAVTIPTPAAYVYTSGTDHTGAVQVGSPD